MGFGAVEVVEKKEQHGLNEVALQPTHHVSPRHVFSSQERYSVGSGPLREYFVGHPNPDKFARSPPRNRPPHRQYHRPLQQEHMAWP